KRAATETKPGHLDRRTAEAASHQIPHARSWRNARTGASDWNRGDRTSSGGLHGREIAPRCTAPSGTSQDQSGKVSGGRVPGRRVGEGIWVWSDPPPLASVQ